jgi:hypothetical protein
MNLFYAKKILFSCSLKCAIDHDQSISNKFFIKVLNSVKWEKHPVYLKSLKISLKRSETVVGGRIRAERVWDGTVRARGKDWNNNCII